MQKRLKKFSLQAGQEDMMDSARLRFVLRDSICSDQHTPGMERAWLFYVVTYLITITAYCALGPFVAADCDQLVPRVLIGNFGGRVVRTRQLSPEKGLLPTLSFQSTSASFMFRCPRAVTRACRHLQEPTKKQKARHEWRPDRPPYSRHVLRRCIAVYLGLTDSERSRR